LLSRQIDVDSRIPDAQKIVIATGSNPRMITSKNILVLASTPNSMIFIGVHAIAMEPSYVLQRVGYSLTALKAMALLLPSMDVSSIGEIERIRIKILENVDAKFIATSGSVQTVSFATPVGQ
jgi:pyruvate/2-oxoglutarate dehydrogenase complex dihydrolipoamide dehydrogenase (E3) component